MLTTYPGNHFAIYTYISNNFLIHLKLIYDNKTGKNVIKVSISRYLR